MIFNNFGVHLRTGRPGFRTTGTICAQVSEKQVMSIITEPAITNMTDNRIGADTIQANSAATQHIVICGMCGAVEKPIGPHKTECPNCDDYIY